MFHVKLYILLGVILLYLYTYPAQITNSPIRYIIAGYQEYWQYPPYKIYYLVIILGYLVLRSTVLYPQFCGAKIQMNLDPPIYKHQISIKNLWLFFPDFPHILICFYYFIVDFWDFFICFIYGIWQYIIDIYICQ